ncbi:MAG TPA: response regulator [Chloroflexota bacterium]|nr:response regulator [Chloroflexota bacterium]
MSGDNSELKVLVADDEEAITELVAFALELEGFQVIQAPDGPEALRLAKEEHPDLAMVDVMMPGLDGREVSRRIKEDPTTARIPVLLFSAAPNPDLTEAKADGFMPKPFDVNQLVDIVRHYISEAANKP